jgi:UDP:flavonoid glycosyltransferase YjiC (YdhE family)
MPNIVLVARGTGGDIYPFIEIGVALKLRGHKVTLITHQQFEGAAREYGLDFSSVDSIEPLALATWTGLFNKIKERCGTEMTAVASHFNANLISQTAAEKLGLSYVTIYTAPYFVPRMTLVEQMLIAETDNINLNRAELNLPAVHDWRAWLRAPKWKLGLWPDWFAPNKAEDWPFEVTPVGFVYNHGFETGDVPDDLKAFIFEGEPAMLITHGTSRPHKPDFFHAPIEACRILNRKAVLVTMYDELEPAYMQGNVRMYKYLPFASVFPHMAAIVHHGGIGTLNQALMAGIPQLALAHGYDRPDNGARLQRMGVGETLAPFRWHPDDVAESLLRILRAEVKDVCKSLSLRHSNKAGSTQRVCDVIELSLRDSVPCA